MTRRASEAAERVPNLPVLEEREQVQHVGLLLITSDRAWPAPSTHRSTAPATAARARSRLRARASLVRHRPPRRVHP